MKFICGWCKSELKIPTDTDVELISTGICDKCKSKLLSGAFERIKFSRPGIYGLVNKN